MASIPFQFWLATFEAKAPPEDVEDSCAAPQVSPHDCAGKRMFAIEILMRGTEFAVAISSVDDLNTPTYLNCCVAFANAAKACDLARQWGFPVVEAEISRIPEDAVRVTLPLFPADSEEDANAMRYESPLLEVRGVDFGHTTRVGNHLDIKYYQSIEAPDAAQPASDITTQPALVRTVRTTFVQRAEKEIRLEVTPARVPDMPFATGTYSARIWSGSMSRVRTPLRASIKARTRRNEPGVGAAANRAYRFEDVEVLGFRIDLRKFRGDAARVLESLIAPLNFHRSASARTAGQHQRTAGLADFRYGSASHTIIIELLRYGRMKEKGGGRIRGRNLGRPRCGFNPDDYQSQHELLVRVLVGRVDDDTGQARDPAVFVPAIFVDNPWSKRVGCEVQGFDKQLASFCMGDNGERPLLPDGRLPGAAPHDPPQPLVTVSQVRHVKEVGSPGGKPILSLDLGADTLDDDAFRTIDPTLASGRSWLAGVRWRQTDFDAAEFRRSFARPVIADGISGTRSVQVSPVDYRRLEKTWIRGNFAVDSVRLAFPTGVATLALHAPKTAPNPWRLLHGLLGGTAVSPSGDWYRMQLSMDLIIDDGLRC